MRTLLKSDGPCFCIEPSAPPSNIRSHSSSSTSILVAWDEVPQEHRNGKIQGYRVLYSDPNGPEQIQTVDTSTRQTSLTDLEKFTLYTIKMFAFTTVGDGPGSSVVSVTTYEDGRSNGRCYARKFFTYSLHEREKEQWIQKDRYCLLCGYFVWPSRSYQRHLNPGKQPFKVNLSEKRV